MEMELSRVMSSDTPFLSMCVDCWTCLLTFCVHFILFFDPRIQKQLSSKDVEHLLHQTKLGENHQIDFSVCVALIGCFSSVLILFFLPLGVHF